MKTFMWALRHPLYAFSWFVTRQPYSNWIVTPAAREYVARLERCCGRSESDVPA